METEVAQFLLRVRNVSAIVIDCNQNMHAISADCGGVPCSGAPAIRYRAPRLVRYIRAHGHPHTPIFMAAGTQYGVDWIGGDTQHARYSAALAGAVAKMRAAGDLQVTMVSGDEFFEGDEYALDADTPTVAGCHSSDLGHMRIAQRWKRVLEPVLAGELPVPEPPTLMATDDGIAPARPAPAPAPIVWTEGHQLGLSGQAVFPPSLPRASPYDRFPAALQATVESEVWEMSRWGSGEFLLFESNSRRLSLNITLQEEYRHYESLMPETGHSGCDLYTWDNSSSTWLWIGSNFPAFLSSAGTGLTLAGEIFSDGRDTNGAFWRPNLIPEEFFAAPRHYMLYLPLYNGAARMAVGVDEGSWVRPDAWSAATFCEKAPVIWFGTSIAQGGAAQRPGAQYLNMLTRRLRRVVINAAFAGPGQEQLNITASIAQMRGKACQAEKTPALPAAIVFDCLPDLRGAANHAVLAPRLKADVAYLRANGHPTTPIVLAEGTDYTDSWAMPSIAAETTSRRALLRRVYEELTAAGDKNVHHVSGTQLWGLDAVEVAEASPTVLGTHPNDLGEERLAHFWAGFFTSLLSQ